MTSPTAPIILNAPRAFDGALEFYWYPPASSGDSALDSYTIVCVSPAGISPITYPAGTHQALITGLTNGTLYEFTIYATNVNSNVGPAASFRPYEPGSGAPAVLASVNVEPGGGNSYAIISWTPPSSLPDSTIFWYVIISQSNNPTDPVIKRTANGLTETSIRIDNLNPASTYTFLVNAVNCPGYGPASSTTPFGPTAESANNYVADTVQNIGPDTNVTELTTFLSGFTASNPAPTPVVTEPSVLITTFVGTAAAGFDANTTYETNFVLLTDNVATINPATLTANSVLYFPMSPGTPISFVTPSTTYSITSGSTTITIDGTPYNLGDYVTLGGVSFQVAFTGSAGLLVATPPPPSSGIIDLGVLSGGTSSVATAVSSDGSIVVGYGTISGGGTRMFTYQSGTMTQVVIPAYITNNFFANGVSGDGSILVGFTNIYGGRGFKYTGGTLTILSPLGGQTSSVTNAISSDGTVIVGYSIDSGGMNHAVKYNSSGTITSLDPYDDYIYSQATAVSSDGSVIVGYGFSGNSGVMEAFYVSGGNLTAFGYIVASGYYTYATGITGDGTIIVGYINDSDTSPSLQQGYIYTIGVSSSSIDAAANIAEYATAGLYFTTITGISADGSTVVGYASSGINSGDERAFKYTVSGSGTYADLGLLSGGFTALAKAVSNDGSIIVGQAQTSGSELHAFRYTA